MVKVIEGNLLAKGKSFGVVVSRFNDFMTKELVNGCIDTLKRHGADDKDITVAWVPGAFELPMIAQKMAKNKSFDALICLGTVSPRSDPAFRLYRLRSGKRRCQGFPG